MPLKSTMYDARPFCSGTCAYTLSPSVPDQEQVLLLGRRVAPRDVGANLVCRSTIAWITDS